MVLLSSRPNHETWNEVRNEELRLEGRSSPILEHGAREIKPSESGSRVMFVPRAKRVGRNRTGQPVRKCIFALAEWEKWVNFGTADVILEWSTSEELK